jgi:hypothetical protein
MVEEEEEVEKELLHFFQTFKNEYLFSDGRDNIGNVRRVLPVPIEEQPPLD